MGRDFIDLSLGKAPVVKEEAQNNVYITTKNVNFQPMQPFGTQQ